MAALVQKTTRDLRWHNRSNLLTRLYLQESVSRNELARASGLSPATVSNVVSDLINDGLVAEAGLMSSAGGRPRSLLRVRPDFGHVVGVDIAETRIRVGLFDWTLTLVAAEVRPIVAERLEPGLVVQEILAGIDGVLARTGIAAADLLGVGVGVPGAVRSDTSASARTRAGAASGHTAGPVVHAPTLGWSGVPLTGLLEHSLGVTVDVDNGAMALGQAETWCGAARGAERAVILLLGVGAGGALSTAARPGRRARALTIEWGHTIVEIDGPTCRCGSRGCLETYIGAEVILRRYLALAGSEPFTSKGTEQRLAELVARDSPAVTRVLDVTATYLGIGVSNLINLLAPDRVILSGWAGAILGPTLLPAIRATAEQHTLTYLRGDTRIELGELGPTATALGAATLPVGRLLAAGGHRVEGGG